MMRGRTVTVTLGRVVDIEVEVWHYAGTPQTLTDQGDPEEAEIRKSVDAWSEEPIELTEDEMKEAIAKAMNVPLDDPDPVDPDPDEKPF